MELREAFDIADADKGGALELDEVSIHIYHIPNHFTYCSLLMLSEKFWPKI